MTKLKIFFAGRKFESDEEPKEAVTTYRDILWRRNVKFKADIQKLVTRNVKFLNSYKTQEVPTIQKSHHPASIKAWCGISYEGVTYIHFCEKGVQTSCIKIVYQNTFNFLM